MDAFGLENHESPEWTRVVARQKSRQERMERKKMMMMMTMRVRVKEIEKSLSIFGSFLDVVIDIDPFFPARYILQNPFNRRRP